MATTAPHIPAWKRLGLKLKVAPDLSLPQDSSKRKRITEEPDLSSVKKAKNHENTSVASPILSLATSVQSTKKPKKTKQEGASSPAKPVVTPQIHRQKSVSFTPDTKQDDGDSIKQLFNGWVAEQKAQDPDFVFATSQPAIRSLETPEVPVIPSEGLSDKEVHAARLDSTKAARPRKEKKEKRSKSSKVQAKPKFDNTAALAYLDRFIDSRESWKFNKRHQIDLLKNIFNEKTVPQTHMSRLIVYIRDLKGLARTNLRDAAIQVKVRDQEAGVQGFEKTMKDVEAKQVEYEAAVNEYESKVKSTESSPGIEEGVLSALSDYNMRSRLIRRMRAEVLLRELAEVGDTGKDAPIPEQRKVNAITGKVVRKRKQRTTIDISSDSSSSEDSDSDSGSESDTKSKASSTKLRSKASVAQNTNSRIEVADTSSSSNNDISSESLPSDPSSDEDED